MRKKIKLKNKETEEILNLDTPICFVANGRCWEFDSVKELMNACEDMEEGEEPKSGIEGIRLNDMILGRHIVEIDFTKVEEAEKAVGKLNAWKRLKDNSWKPVHYNIATREASVIFSTGYTITEQDRKDLDLLFSGGEE